MFFALCNLNVLRLLQGFIFDVVIEESHSLLYLSANYSAAFLSRGLATSHTSWIFYNRIQLNPAYISCYCFYNLYYIHKKLHVRSMSS
jgi:hypothetical protein